MTTQFIVKCYKCRARIFTSVIGTVWFHGPHSEVTCTRCTPREHGNFVPRYVDVKGMFDSFDVRVS